MARITPCMLKAFRAKTGFTLVEILVTISIIAILAAISIPVMNQLLQRGAESQSKVLLRQLESAVSEYVAQTRKDPLTAVAHYSYPAGSGKTGFNAAVTDEQASVRELVDVRLLQVEPALEMINTVNAQLVHERDAQQNVRVVKDAWNAPVRFYPGSRALEAAGSAYDSLRDPVFLGSIGMRLRPSPYFASAGQDGTWGEIDPVTDLPLPTGAGDNFAADNLYSFEAD